MTSVYPGRPQADDCLLLLIDLQERLFPALREQKLLARNAARLARFASIMDIPVIVSEQVNLGPTIANVLNTIDNPTRITKSTFSCFGEIGFTDLLAQYDESTLVVAGAETHVCVMQTALDASRTHRVIVANDAVSTRSEHDHNAALEHMAQYGIEIQTTEMLMFELLGNCTRPEFKPVLQLIKK